VIQLVGGRGAFRDYPVERAFRDLRTCTLMTPTPDRMLETIGKSALGIDTAMLNVNVDMGGPEMAPHTPLGARRTPAEPWRAS